MVREMMQPERERERLHTYCSQRMMMSDFFLRINRRTSKAKWTFCLKFYLDSVPHEAAVSGSNCFFLFCIFLFNFAVNDEPSYQFHN